MSYLENPRGGGRGGGDRGRGGGGRGDYGGGFGGGRGDHGGGWGLVEEEVVVLAEAAVVALLIFASSGKYLAHLSHLYTDQELTLCVRDSNPSVPAPAPDLQLMGIEDNYMKPPKVSADLQIFQSLRRCLHAQETARWERKSWCMLITSSSSSPRNYP